MHLDGTWIQLVCCAYSDVLVPVCISDRQTEGDRGIQGEGVINSYMGKVT